MAGNSSEGWYSNGQGYKYWNTYTPKQGNYSGYDTLGNSWQIDPSNSSGCVIDSTGASEWWYTDPAGGIYTFDSNGASQYESPSGTSNWYANGDGFTVYENKNSDGSLMEYDNTGNYEYET